MAAVKKNAKAQLTDAIQGTDPTNQPQATSKAEVDAQDTRTRLWQSLSNTYGAKIEESNKAYDQARANADLQAISRGMGRSSYNNQVLANIDQEKINAQNKINSELIADYQGRVSDLDRQDKEDERWERQFAYQTERDRVSDAFQREQMDYQRERDEHSDAQWRRQFNYQRQRDEINDAFQREQFQEQQRQWREQFDYNRMTADQQIAYNYLMNMLETGDNPSEDILRRAGISRADYEMMKTKVTSSGSGKPKTTGDEEDKITPWARLGLTEEQYYALYGDRRTANNLNAAAIPRYGSDGVEHESIDPNYWVYTYRQ